MKRLTKELRRELITTMIVHDTPVDGRKYTTIKEKYLCGIIYYMEAYTKLFELVNRNSVEEVYRLSPTQFDTVVKEYLAVK